MNTAPHLKATILATCLTSLFLGACANNQGEFRQQTATGVNLGKSNYKVVKAGVRGESTGFKLLGIIPFSSPNYADAKAALYTNAGENLSGRSIALANQTEDRSSTYLILFSIPKVTVTADLIEFTDEHEKPAKK